jgi:hypothetical protein
MGRALAARNNSIRSAMRYVRSFLWLQCGLSAYRVKRKELIRRFAAESGYTVPQGQSPEGWLVELYHSGEDENVARQDVGFYLSREWIDLRKSVLRHYGPICMKCGCAGEPSVDHIKSRSLFPALELEFSNMQVLCRRCNSSKSNRHEIDYRESVCA